MRRVSDSSRRQKERQPEGLKCDGWKNRKEKETRRKRGVGLFDAPLSKGAEKMIIGRLARGTQIPIILAMGPGPGTAIT